MRNTNARTRVKNLARRYTDHDINGLAAELSYRVVLALFPLFVFLAALGAWVASASGTENPAQEMVDTLGDTLPDDAASLVERELEALINAPGTAPLVLGLIAALWTGTMAMAAAVKALNRIHGLEDGRPARIRFPIALGLTIAGGALLLLAGAAWISSQAFGPDIARSMGLPEGWGAVGGFALLPAAFIAVVGMATLVYWAAPAKSRGFRWVSLGGVAFGIVWLLGSLGFAIYVHNFSNMNAVYGALSGVIVALTWIYLTSTAFLLGAEFDLLVSEEAGDKSG